MKRIIAILLCSSALLIPVSPVFGEEYTDPAVPIEVKVGEVFVIALPSTAGTGYGWRLAAGLDGTILKLEGSRFESPTGRRLAKVGRRGAKGKELLTFRALKEGKAEIALKYSRIWEKEKPPAEEATFSVLVQPGEAGRITSLPTASIPVPGTTP